LRIINNAYLIYHEEFLLVIRGRRKDTNNLAEQMIRTLAIWRKTSFGTQSPVGSLYMERIMFVVATCKLQSRNILE